MRHTILEEFANMMLLSYETTSAKSWKDWELDSSEIEKLEQIDDL